MAESKSKKRRQVARVSREEVDEATSEPIPRKEPVKFDRVVSTGSTLLDLSISGGRVRGGGIPPGIVVEFYGPPGAGKSALLAEVCASGQQKGGDIMFLDPEGRLDRAYAQIYGVSLDKENYIKPDLVTGLFDQVREWKPEPQDSEAINVMAADSLAAFTTETEMSGEEKRGQGRSREFSMGFRAQARLLSDSKRLLVCSNQVRETDSGKADSTGGFAIKFYCSLRLHVNYAYPAWKVERTRKADSGKPLTKQVGIMSTVRVAKSSVDDPYRTADIYVMFGYGVDDVRGNLAWLKYVTGDSRFGIEGAAAQSIDKAIDKVEEQALEAKLRDEVIGMWEEIEEKFKVSRKPKSR